MGLFRELTIQMLHHQVHRFGNLSTNSSDHF